MRTMGHQRTVLVDIQLDVVSDENFPELPVYDQDPGMQRSPQADNKSRSFASTDCRTQFEEK
uniref:Uncharacterized protein n=1 Tax=Romanomermis culicivorax TaxID=13658 RepID=A0A915I4N0_ROMCU